MKQRETKKQDARAEKELRGTYWGIAAVVLLYLTLVCLVKGSSFALVAVAAVAVVVTAAAVAVADRLME